MSKKEIALKILKFPLKNLPRQLLTGFLYNTSCYFYWIVVPLLFNEQGATAFELALLQLVCFSNNQEYEQLLNCILYVIVLDL